MNEEQLVACQNARASATRETLVNCRFISGPWEGKKAALLGVRFFRRSTPLNIELNKPWPASTYGVRINSVVFLRSLPFLRTIPVTLPKLLLYGFFITARIRYKLRRD